MKYRITVGYKKGSRKQEQIYFMMSEGDCRTTLQNLQDTSSDARRMNTDLGGEVKMGQGGTSMGKA